jgi:hypothetical protein
MREDLKMLLGEFISLGKLLDEKEFVSYKIEQATKNLSAIAPNPPVNFEDVSERVLGIKLINQIFGKNNCFKILNFGNIESICCDCKKIFEAPIRTLKDFNLKQANKQASFVCDSCKCTRRVKQENLLKIKEQYLSSLKSCSYSDYLKSAHWQELRTKKLRYSRFACELCNNKGVLHVHHRTYQNRGQERLSDLIVLCEPCHFTFHNKLEVSNDN